MKYLKDLDFYSDYELMEYMDKMNKRKEELFLEQELLLEESSHWAAAMQSLIFEMKARDLRDNTYFLYVGEWDSTIQH